MYRFAQEVDPASVRGMEKEDLEAFVRVARRLGASLSTALATAATSDEEEMASRPPGRRWRTLVGPEGSTSGSAPVARQVGR